MSRVTTVVVASLSLVSESQPAVAQTRAVTLDEALVLATRYSPMIIQALGDIRIAQATRRESVSDWLPRVTGSSGWSINSSQRFDPQTQRTVSGSATSVNGSLSASYTLFDGFRRNAQSRSRIAAL